MINQMGFPMFMNKFLINGLIVVDAIGNGAPVFNKFPGRISMLGTEDLQIGNERFPGPFKIDLPAV